MFTFTTQMTGERIKMFALMSSLVLSFAANAQTIEQTNDSKLLDSFIQSKGYGSTITFSASNIKQFWIDKSVISQDNLIKVFIDGTKSVPYKIQLANVNETLDCKVDIISNTPDLKFSVLNNDSKVISQSSKEDDFINYNIASASFHLEDTNSLSFYLQFSSASPMNELRIGKIILSFSNNKNTSFLASPGTLIISDANCTGPEIKKMDGNNTFSISSTRGGLKSNNKIYVSNNTISNSVRIKNIGKHPTTIYLGYAPYTKEGKLIDNRHNPYDNKIMNVVAFEKNSNTIVVDSEPKWKKGCFLALDVKEDFSDFPNTSLATGRIQSVNKIDESHFEIVFDKPHKQEIKIGTSVRIHCPEGATYLYTNTKKLLPGEEVKLSSSITKDDAYILFGTEKFCRGTYYVIPILLSFSVDKTETNTIQISDFTINY